MTNQYSYELSLNILRALGGDMTVQYENTDQIWAAIDDVYAVSGDGLDLQALVLNITENGTYNYNVTDTIDAYVPVNITVDIKQKYTDEQVEDLKDTAREEGYTSGYTKGQTTGYQSGYTEGQTAGYTDGYDKGVADGYVQGESEGYNDGYSEGLEDGAEDQKALLEEITIKDNGVYEKEDGYKKVTVEVPIPEMPTFETESLTKTLKTNGTYNYTPTTDGFSDVHITVDVPTGGGDTGKPKIYNGFQFTGGDIAQVDFSQYDWSSVYDTSYFFENCRHSTGDWSNFEENFNGKILSGSYMFSNCSSLTSIPQLDTSNVTLMNRMFEYCSKLTSIPPLDTSNVTDMNNMFYYCSNLTSIPPLDTSNVTDMSYMFALCSNLTSIQKLYCGKITSGSTIDIFGQSQTPNITYLGGFEDLGKVSGFNKPVYFLKNCPNLTKESVMNVINNLYDRKSAGYSVVTLPFNTNSLALLSDEEKAIATNKGWTLATS